jgi:hypothetical protein
VGGFKIAAFEDPVNGLERTTWRESSRAIESDLAADTPAIAHPSVHENPRGVIEGRSIVA